MVKTKKVNKNRSKLFGVVINPKLDERMNWESLSSLEVGEKLKAMKFLNKFLLTEYLNNLEVENVSNNLTSIEDFSGQLELGTESKIPHYQLAIEMKSICTKKKVLESPLPWQEFLETNILRKNPDDRTVDWVIDPIGNTGKSSFARVYISKEVTDGIFMKIDNLDRMELSLIKKIESYRLKYYKDPKVLLFDFPRASDISKVLAATALMEDAKCGYLESTFGGTDKQIQIGDIHIIVWPVAVRPWGKTINTRNWNII